MASSKTAVGEPLIWDNAESKKSARIYLRKSADIEDRDDWPQQHEWLREHLEKLHAVFSPIVRGF